MSNISLCNDTSEAMELYKPQGLYLKPVAKINISAQLPQLKTPGKTISNWEVMEKVKTMVRPDIFISVKVAKSTMEFLRLEGEIENRSKLPILIMKLDGKSIKLAGFSETLKVRAAEAKTSFPVRHDWDSFFRDARHMNEMKAGERPDTIHLKDLPTRWFAKDGGRSATLDQKPRPSEEILRKVFETFGEVRCLDIPMLDPYRKEIMGSLAKPGMIQTFSYAQDVQFEAYVQFRDYISFVKAMDAFRGMRLLYLEDPDKAFTANIKVDFDRGKHLSDRMIRKRRMEREKLEALENLRLEKVQQEREEEELKREAERQKKLAIEREKQKKREERQRMKEQRRREREEKRRQKRMEKKQKEEEERMQLKIALEERRLLIAQRKLESLRLLSELFERVKEDKIKQDMEKRRKEEEEKRRQQQLEEQRKRLEEARQKAEAKIQKKLQMQQEQAKEKVEAPPSAKAAEDKQREELRLKLKGSARLKSAVIMKKRLSSIVHGRESSPSDEEPAPALKESKEKPVTVKKEPKSDDNDDGDKKGDEKAKSDEKGKEDGGSGIESISSSSDTEDGPSQKKKKKSSSALERVLKANRLRAWGGKPDEEDEEGGDKKDKKQKPVSRMLPPRRPLTVTKKKSNKNKILIVKRVPDEEMMKKDSDDDDDDDGGNDSSDSGDSTVTIIPPSPLLLRPAG
ncbi:uncharacterized protein LOC143299203 [Babylonia areolata]|uniref:uncharacterized protein LOC143299203 n=1 Tax=Babylonia areolata TaxID=304850 RepID=UPI003FD0BB03